MIKAPWKTATLVSLATALACIGCSANLRRSIATPSVAIAVGTKGGAPPSAAQVARIHQALKPELLRAGFSLSTTRETADFIVTVNFSPSPDDEGGRVTVTGIGPSAQFRAATDGGDTAEAKEWRRRQREYEQWAERQVRSDSQ